MQTTWGWAIGGVVVAILVALGLLVLNYPREDRQPASGAATSTDAYAAATSTGGASRSVASGRAAAPPAHSFRAILAQTGNHQCLYGGVAGDVRTNDTVDIADGKLYAAFRTMNASGTATNDLMVFDGRYLYTWVEGKTTGTRTVINSLSDLPRAIPGNLSSSAIFGTSDQNIGWDCHPWLTDRSLLVPPSYVTFSAAAY